MAAKVLNLEIMIPHSYARLTKRVDSTYSLKESLQMSKTKVRDSGEMSLMRRLPRRWKWPLRVSQSPLRNCQRRLSCTQVWEKSLWTCSLKSVLRQLKTLSLMHAMVTMTELSFIGSLRAL